VAVDKTIVFIMPTVRVEAHGHCRLGWRMRGRNGGCCGKAPCISVAASPASFNAIVAAVGWIEVCAATTLGRNAVLVLVGG
jgi:hypothetical protein